MSHQRLRLEIQGAVQGVGFRPFIYRLATELALPGWIINDTHGVFIEVEGSPDVLHNFLARIPHEAPPHARIHSLQPSWLEPVGYQQFEIRHSNEQGPRTVLVLPDIATCAECLAEVHNPLNRRYRYPFTNCTSCGPRFTIIHSLPYDRPGTSMRHFAMCPTCQTEYDSPLDRRFHAQPNACSICGPQVILWVRTEHQEPASQLAVIATGDAALQRAAEELRAGKIVAVKGLGGFHIIVDARNAQAIARLRERKPRRDKPFALMLRDLDQAATLCDISPPIEALLSSPEAPIVIAPRRADALIANNVAPGNPTLGIMLPYTPLHHLLLHAAGFPVVATSGNLSDEPICTDEYDAVARLGHIADTFLVHNRPIVRHVDDSIAWLVSGKVQLLRRARGYAPLPVLLPHPVPTILAVGAHLKNTVALSVDRQVFISQHIGDMEAPEAVAAFERVIADFLQLYAATPLAIAHDMHPDYLSTRWAKEAKEAHEALESRDSVEASRREGEQPSILRYVAPSCQLIPVQHHHAHLAASLAEHGLTGQALGVTWDGTGYGTDGTVWGGEFLLGDAADFTRVAHLRPFHLPGGEAAIREPRRVALALLWELYGEAALEQHDLLPVQASTPAEQRLLTQMLRRGFNTPVTTSAGRLFDGIAALIGLQQRVTFEGQAAMSLEFIADADVYEAYPFPLVTLTSHQQPATPPHNALPYARSAGIVPAYPRSHHTLSPHASLILDWIPLIEAIITDLRRGVKASMIAAKFHNALVQIILNVAQTIGEPRVALTGGCFQNRWLTERTTQRLSEAGFEVLLHRQVPPNDGGISLGQVVVAAARMAR